MIKDFLVATDSNLRVDGGRLWNSLMRMAEIGATERGGVCRLTLTDLDRESRDLFARWCADAGCAMTVDRMGNMFARRAGEDDALPPVMVGSHLDSQPTGGKFDGALGVLAALEVVRTLNDREIRTRHPIEVANWTNEEGARFAPPMVASGVFGGVFALKDGLASTDLDGKTIGEELSRIGYAGDAPVGGRPVHAFFELHIEQGPILEGENIDVGVVTHAQGQRWYDVTFTGQESHAGTTPFERRKDALVGAAKLATLVDRLGREGAPHARATVGLMEVFPNSRNVIPGQVRFSIDTRNPDDDALLEMGNRLREGAAAIAHEHGLEHGFEQLFYYPPLAFDPSCVDTVRSAAERLGYSHRDIISGAGHDACYVAKVAPTSMVFTPCVDGISHNEAEDCKPEWVTAGTDVLLHAVLDKAEIVG